MEWVKTTAKTLPEAIDLALDNLGVDEAEAEIVVLEEPRQGLFGRMRGTARVEARVKPKAIRPKAERGRGRRSRSDGGGGRSNDRNRNRSRNRSGKGQGRSQGDGDQGSNRDDERRNDGGRNDGGGRGGSNRSKGRSKQRDDGRSGQRGGDRSGQGSGGGRSGQRGGGRSGQNEQRGDRSSGRKNETQEGARRDEPIKEAPMEEVSAQLRTFLVGLTEAFGFDSDVTIDESEEDVLVGTIEGQHGLLVGPKGRTLDAVQELARISCQRATPSSIRIRVDVGGYRKQRGEALTAFAEAAAEEAVDNAVEVALEPMSAADRKVIHDALSEDGRVETRSVGTEPRRKVLVVPLEDAIDDSDDVDDGDDGDEAEHESDAGEPEATASNGDSADDTAADVEPEGSADDVELDDSADDVELDDSADEAADDVEPEDTEEPAAVGEES